MFLVGTVTAALFAQGVYSPCKPQAAELLFYEDHVSALSMSLFKSFNSSLVAYRPLSLAGNLTQLSPGRYKNLSTAVNINYMANKQAVDAAKNASGE